GADAGEIQSIAAADVAVKNLADMKRQSEAETFDGVIVIGISQGLDQGAGFARGVKNAAADLRGIAATVGNWEYRQKSVAHEFQNLSAMPQDRFDLAVEVTIEHVHHGFRR